jgi:hypothetical protein
MVTNKAVGRIVMIPDFPGSGYLMSKSSTMSGVGWSAVAR